MTNEIVIAGAGTGEMTLTQEVKNALDDADVVFADRRLAELIPVGKKIVDIKNFADLENESGKILLLVSGDAGCFSLLTVVKKKFPGKKITVIPGISSLQVICAKAEETWQDAKILSGHGRALKESTFLTTVERNRLTILFCDSKISPSWACEKLLCLDVEVVIGSCLGGNDEKIFSGSPIKELLQYCAFLNKIHSLSYYDISCDILFGNKLLDLLNVKLIHICKSLVFLFEVFCGSFEIFKLCDLFKSESYLDLLLCFIGILLAE